ncbi:MAG: hypothetical protein JW712_03380 [Dehalococcoidales bacterium]|nr:hypothetical protein [Dehalococcoidales bacterium]
MALDYIITTGNFLQIMMNPPEVYPTLVAPIPLTGSSSDMKVLKMPVCLEGDETPPLLLSPQPYLSPSFPVPGMGTVTVKIQSANKTTKTKNGGKAILLKGQTFQVEFDVTVPAQLIAPPSPPVPDSNMKKSGTAQFITTNMMVKAE